MTIFVQRICLVAFQNKQYEIRIMKNKRKLKKLTKERIYIDNDCTLKEGTSNKENIQKTAMKGRQKRSKVKVVYGKMVVDRKE